MDTKELLEAIKNMSDEDKKSLVNILSPKKTIKKKTAKKKTVKKKKNINIFDEEEAANDPEVRKASEVSEKLYSNRQGSNQSKRPETKMVKIKCKNCGRSYTISPELAHNFICCLRNK